MINRDVSGLWSHPDFMKLWIGQTISEFGSRITREALPLTAVIVLSASPEQMGLLALVSSLPILLLGLVAGVWIDRLRRRPILIAADVIRMLVLLSIPAAALSGYLNMALVYIVAVITGIVTLFFDAAYRAYLPSLVKREQLLEGNSKLAITDSLAEIGGPALAGVLIQIMSAPLAIFFDAISFLFSALSVGLIHAPEAKPKTEASAEAPTEQTSLHREILDGLYVLRQNPVLRTLAIGIGVRSFFGYFFAALYSLYVIRELGLTPTVLGVVIAAGGVGALVGAFFAQRAARRWGLGRTLTRTLLVGSIIGLLTPLAGGPVVLVAGILIVAQLVNDAAMMIFFIHEMSLRQMLVPNHLLGRTNASISFLEHGIAPVGALIAGVLAGIIGARVTLLVAVLGILATAATMYFSPVRHLSEQAEVVNQ